MSIDIRLFLRLGKFITSIAVIIILTGVIAQARSPQPKDGIDTLAAQMVDADPAERVLAVTGLHERGLEAMPALIDLLGNGSQNERRGAALGLAIIPMPALASDALITALGDTDVTTRSLAAHTLAIAGPCTARQLTGLLADKKENTRAAAAYALKLMGEKAIPALVRTLASDQDLAVANAALLLGSMEGAATAAVPALIRALNTDNIRVMHVVAEAIDLIGGDPATIYYHLQLLGPDVNGFTLKRNGTETAPLLTRLLSRPGTPLSQLAFRALAAIGDDAKPALSTAVRTGTPSQQTAAALLLIAIDPKEILTLPEDLRMSLSGATYKP